ncbi:MAG: hypothetical protein ACRD2N_16775 [Vicinamibacterales bacterium]
MTTGKAWALALGLVGVIALGVWVAPKIADRASSPSTVGEQTTPTPDQAAAEPENANRPKAVTPRGSTPEATTAAAEPELPKLSPQMPELLDRLQPLLNKGADMKIASEGFRDAELFASVAHAAKNTQVPFVLLKQRVLREGKTLDRAIAELKPSVNATIEATRARAEARSDIASLAAAL